MECISLLEKVPVIDVFAGAGGLGEGFSPASDETTSHFDVRLSIEMDDSAAETLKLRAFFRHSEKKARDDYYSFLDGKLSLDELYERNPETANRAGQEVYHIELGGEKFDENELNARTSEAIGDADKWVLVGGPPCQAYSSIGRARNAGIRDYSAAADHRHFLYEEYLRIIASHWPSVFVMENVPGILSSRAGGTSRLFGKILDDLSDPASVFPQKIGPYGETFNYRIVPLYSKQQTIIDLFGTTGNPTDYIVQSEQHGVPQSRRRVILLGIRDDIDPDGFDGLQPCDDDPIPASAVLKGMPRLRSGLAETDSDPANAWFNAVASALDSEWIKELASLGQENVANEIKSIVSKLKHPKLGQGGKFVQYAQRDLQLKERHPALYSWIVDERMSTVCNSETRDHMESDLHRYLYVSAYGKVNKVSPRLRHFPKGLLPDHDNVKKALQRGDFQDRFRVQLKHQPSATVVSHLGRDGHYFIHYDPSQVRSITVREAARLQTFPDNFFFCGSRGAQYSQVGNAVPPLLAKQIADVVWKLLSDEPERSKRRLSKSKRPLREVSL